MSLLMDALKKAEEEKKQAAKRLQEVEVDSLEATSNQETTENGTTEAIFEEDSVPELFNETSQFSLEPLSIEESTNDLGEEENNIEDKEWEIETVDASEAFSEDLTLENTVPDEVPTQETFEETQKVVDLNDTTIIEGLSTENAAAPFDDTFHGVVFDEEPDTDIYEETLPGVSADTLASDLGGGSFQPTPVAAKTVFSTGKPVKTKSSFKWGMFALLALLAAGSFAIFYYFTITPVSRDLPSPLVARGIEFSGVETPIIVPPIVEQQGSQDQIEAVTESAESIVIEEELANKQIVERAFEDEKSEKQALIANFDKSSIESVPEIEMFEETAEIEPVVEEVVSNTIIEEKFVEPDIVEQQDIERVENTTLIPEPEKRQLDTSLINISKSKKDNQKNVIVEQAFNAYQAGQYDAAKSIYEGILKSEPDNRDAHLGLAAIAINKKDRKAAYLHYIHLVELNPLDTLAMSSLIALSNRPDPVKDESAIKLLLQRDDSLPYLHFLLGNLYAKQKRWANAQQAFFNAYRIEPTNPDYLLNLAISLDQLGQYKTALDYYKSAMDLSENSVSGFDLRPITNRISSLTKLIESK